MSDRDLVKAVSELRTGDATPQWFNRDVILAELAQRLLELEARVHALEPQVGTGL